MLIIILIMLILFWVLIRWTWHNLGSINLKNKVLITGICMLILFLLTLVTFNISAQGLQYSSPEKIDKVRTIFVILFTLINGIFLMPSVSKTFNNFYEKKLDTIQTRNKIILILGLIILFLIFECGYMKNIQVDMFKIYSNLK